MQSSNPFTGALTRPLRQHDYGFFGPGSPTWKVWTSPTAIIGFQRAVVLEHFDPFLTAAAADQGRIYSDPHGRLDRTFAYFLLVAIADSRTVIEASEFLMRIHAPLTGLEPVSGTRYNANNPDSQLWIHLTAWQSVLKCYEVFGPGKLSPEEERQYWAECAIAAELQTCRVEDIPRDREGVREYYASMRPRLCVTERAVRGMQHLLRPHRDDVGTTLWAGGNLLSLATVATIPGWMRDLGQLNGPAPIGPAVIPAVRALVLAASSDKAKTGMLNALTPLSGKILQSHFDGTEPELAETVTIAQAQELYGAEAKRAVKSASA